MRGSRREIAGTLLALASFLALPWALVSAFVELFITQLGFETAPDIHFGLLLGSMSMNGLGQGILILIVVFSRYVESQWPHQLATGFLACSLALGGFVFLLPHYQLWRPLLSSPVLSLSCAAASLTAAMLLMPPKPYPLPS